MRKIDRKIPSLGNIFKTLTVDKPPELFTISDGSVKSFLGNFKEYVNGGRKKELKDCVSDGTVAYICIELDIKKDELDDEELQSYLNDQIGVSHQTSLQCLERLEKVQIDCSEPNVTSKFRNLFIQFKSALIELNLSSIPNTHGRVLSEIRQVDLLIEKMPTSLQSKLKLKFYF